MTWNEFMQITYYVAVRCELPLFTRAYSVLSSSANRYMLHPLNPLLNMFLLCLYWRHVIKIVYYDYHNSLCVFVCISTHFTFHKCICLYASLSFVDVDTDTVTFFFFFYLLLEIKCSCIFKINKMEQFKMTKSLHNRTKL